MDRAPPVQRTALHSDHVRPLDDLPQPTDRPAPSLDARSPKERHPKMPVPQVEAAPPCSTTPHPNNSAGGDVAQTRSPAGIVEQPPAAVLAFPMRNSNFARGCIASLDVSPAARITGFAIADCAAVHPRPMKYRHIQAGDCAAYPAGKVIQRKRRGRKVCLRTIRNHINEMVAAGLNRRRTTRTNTYVFTLPEQPQKHPGIRAEIADNCTLFCTSDCTPKEPRTESRREDPSPPRACVTAAPRNRCSCGHTWPAEYGDECHECKRADREERRRRRRRDPPRPPTSTGTEQRPGADRPNRPLPAHPRLPRQRPGEPGSSTSNSRSNDGGAAPTPHRAGLATGTRAADRGRDDPHQDLDGKHHR